MNFSSLSIFTCVLLLVTLFSTCKSLEELYGAGEYDKAFKAAAKQLDQKPQDQQALTVLKNSLAALITEKQEAFVNLSASQEVEDWEKALDVIAEMDELIEEAQLYLPTPFAEEQKQWWAEALALEEQLYYHYLESGKSQLAESVAQELASLGQQAYYHFERAIHYQQPGFAEAEQLTEYLAEAQKAGTVYYKVAINKGFNTGLRLNIERAFSDIEDTDNPFLDVEIVFIANGGDCTIDIDFGEFDTRISESSSTEDFKKQVLIRHDTEVDTSGFATTTPVYEEVEATVTTFISTKIATWEVKVDVGSRTKNCTIFSERYQRELISTYEYTRSSGDSRAIPTYSPSGFSTQHPSDSDMAEDLLYDLVELIYRDYFE